MYEIKFTLGDWSGDGHHQHKSYIVCSSKAVEHLRELHHKFKEVHGWDIGDICKEYEESYPSDFHIEELRKLNITVPKKDVWYESNITYTLLSIWLKLLKSMDSYLVVYIKKVPEYPLMHYYGYDEKDRHLSVPGYGLFE